MADTQAPDEAWLGAEADRLAGAVSAARHPDGGFGWLDESCRRVADRPVETWFTSRMTHVAGLQLMRGRAADDDLDHGVQALRGLLHDHEHGGWFASAGPDGQRQKKAYDHVFVVLAASTATVAGHPDGPALLQDALDVLLTRFWDDERGLVLDVWDRTWTELEAYRGANANMHAVEAMLAAADATGDDAWHERALRITGTLVDGHARAHHWRLPEHFDEQWQVLPDYNRDDPAHPFRPYGSTVGHWFEWSRLLLHLRHGRPDAPSWLLEDARELFGAATREGWAVDGSDGFVYTVDDDGAPVVRQRLHWVVCEAIAAAEVWQRTAASDDVQRRLAQWWHYARTHLVDLDRGGWHHELSADNSPAAGTWSGKPDVYHAYQACMLGLLPTGRSLAGALRAWPSAQP